MLLLLLLLFEFKKTNKILHSAACLHCSIKKLMLYWLLFKKELVFLLKTAINVINLYMSLSDGHVFFSLHAF